MARRRFWILSCIMLWCAAGAGTLALLTNTQPAAAQSCTVPGGYTTLQAAVDDTNCAEISLAAGTYTENVTVNRSVTIRGAGEGQTLVDGGGADRVFVIAAGVVMVIEDLSIANGFVTAAGAGIYNQGILSLRRVTVRDNVATGGIAGTGVKGVTYGGGLYNTGIVTLTSSTVYSNSASFGGGIMSDSSGRVTVDEGPVFEMNRAIGSAGTPGSLTGAGGGGAGMGGAIYNGPAAHLSITASTIRRNEVIGGAGGRGYGNAGEFIGLGGFGGGVAGGAGAGGNATGKGGNGGQFSGGGGGGGHNTPPGKAALVAMAAAVAQPVD